ncbi:MAG: prepilin peptidase [Planctomycetes bacterium]|nr:prepilin peptidase [Planctomycetota bacterium]
MNQLHILYLIFSGIFGAFIGSFLNVCICRLPEEKSLIFPGSHCPKCDSAIRWYDNIPVLSYVILQGKCRNCSEKISLQYPMIELLTSGVFVFAMYMFIVRLQRPAAVEDFIMFFAAIFLSSCLVVVTIIDIKLRIIPDMAWISLLVFGIITSGFCPFLQDPLPFETSLSPEAQALISSIAGAILGSGVIYLTGIIGKLVFRKEAMGLGDVYLMAGLGAFLGWQSILLVFLIGCIAGSFIGLFSLLLTKDHYIPFGPFLSLGAFIMFFFKIPVLIFISRDYPNFIRKAMLIFS